MKDKDVEIITRMRFKTSFCDCKRKQIREGDILLEVVEICKSERPNGRRVAVSMMGNETIVDDHGDQWFEDGWSKRVVMWSGSCLVAEKIDDSGNFDISPPRFHYLNEAFKGKDFRIVGSIYDFDSGTIETDAKMWCGNEWRTKTYTIIGKGKMSESQVEWHKDAIRKREKEK